MNATPLSEVIPTATLTAVASEMTDRNRVRSVDRAVSLLVALGSWEGGAGVTEIAESLRLQRSTASRLLATLNKHGLVQRDDESGKYRLGLALVLLGTHAGKTIDLKSIARPQLQAVARAIQETTSLGVLDQDRVARLVWSDPLGRLHEQVGRTYPLHATAPGKVLLSSQPEREVIRLANAGFVPYTPRTIVRVDSLLEEIARVRARGFATAFGEHEPAVNSVAMPVYDDRGSVVAAVEVRATGNRISPSRVPALIEAIRVAAATITEQIGGTPVFI
jgi:DNA-binding IclR family transcriptional regulator